MYGSLFLFQAICVASIFSASIPNTPKCKLTDTECLNNLINVLYKQSVEGNEKLGMENLAPIHIDKLETDLSVVKYSLQNSTCYGFDKCKLVNIQYTPGSFKIHMDLICPKFELNGHYEIDGQLITIPIQGKGPYSLVAKNYLIKLDCDIKKTTGKDDKTYIGIKKYIMKPELRGDMDFNLENLFDGRQDLAAPVHKFIKENPKAVADFLQGPIFELNIKKIMKNLNKVLKESSLEDFIEL